MASLLKRTLRGLMILALLEPTASLAEPEVVPLDDWIEEVVSGTRSPQPQPCDGTCSEKDVNFTFEDFAPRTLAPMLCNDDPIDAEKVCRSISKWCSSTYRSKACTVQYTNWEVLRMGDSEKARNLQTRAYTHAQRFFNSIVNNKKVQDRCCGNRKGCAKFFAETKLVVLGGLPAEEDVAWYRTAKHRVELSESEFIRHYTHQTFEEVLLHELGHACQHARHHDEEVSLDWITWESDMCPQGETISYVDFKYALGEEMRKCVWKAIKEEHHRFPGPICDGAWYREAFASAIFSEWMVDFSHYARACVTLTDKLHTTTRALMPCFFKRKETREALCGKTN